MQAAAALAGIRNSKNRVEKGIENANFLLSRLRKSECVLYPESTPDQPHGFLYFPVIFLDSDRYAVSKEYSKHGIETKWRYYPLHLQNGFGTCRYENLSNTEKYWYRYLLIPSGVALNEDQLGHVVETTNGIVMK